MKDVAVRDKFAMEWDVVCFEIEAAGQMYHFPCLIIRGICDCADSHKNKDWEGFAVIMAATYAKDLLSHSPSRKVEVTTRILEVLGSGQFRYLQLGLFSASLIGSNQW